MYPTATADDLNPEAWGTPEPVKIDLRSTVDEPMPTHDSNWGTPPEPTRPLPNSQFTVFVDRATANSTPGWTQAYIASENVWVHRMEGVLPFHEYCYRMEDWA